MGDLPLQTVDLLLLQVDLTLLLDLRRLALSYLLPQSSDLFVLLVDPSALPLNLLILGDGPLLSTFDQLLLGVERHLQMLYADLLSLGFACFVQAHQ